MDTLLQWQKTYSRELDRDTKQECVATEKLLRKALAGGGEASSKQFDLGFPFKCVALNVCSPLISVEHSACCSGTGQAF